MSAVTAEAVLVGPYRILKAIGAGGSARIDLARIERAYGFQRHVVIKRPLEHLRNDASVATSLRREAELGGRLRHPNLVAVLDAGQHDGYDYLSIEYVHGASLRTLMQTQSHADAETGAVRQLPLGAALSIVIDVARGLHEAHQLTGLDGTDLGLVHRDVSPNNVLLGADGTVKVSDFGIAKDTRVSTLSGSMRGTVTYMAPEQCRGHAFDRRADVFSLGVILFELVTARRLFWADNDVASLHKVLSGQIPDPRTLVNNLAPELAAIMLSAVAPAAEARMTTTGELADRLEAYAAAAGVGIGARWIARTMEAELGIRSAPWIELEPKATEPFVREPANEPSLVAVIERTLDLDEVPLAPTFGDPADLLDEPAAPEVLGATTQFVAPDVSATLSLRAPSLATTPFVAPDVSAPLPAPSLATTTPFARRPRRPRRALLALGLLGCAGLGVAIAIGVTSTAGEPEAESTPAASVSAPAIAPATAPTHVDPPSPAPGSPTSVETTAPVEPAATTESGPPALPVEPAGSAADPAATADPPRPRRRTPPRVTPAIAPDAGVEATPDAAREIAPSPAADAGVPVQWNPNLVLPTDPPTPKPRRTTP
ncbi:MAG: protein kinase [Myxococcales bacterium]|nr:protein kinase [Myxococcales bacterium]